MKSGRTTLQKLAAYIVIVAILPPGRAARGEQEVSREVPPGYMIIEGDMIVPEDFYSPLRGTYATNLWPGGVVPYAFEAGLDATQQQQAINAMYEWERRALVDFIPRTGETAYIYFRDSTGNSSFVGRMGSGQYVNIHDWGQKFIIVHELGHALGFYHEQSRTDRNTYVQINWGNIQPGYSNNFNLIDASSHHGPYDFDSLMHYDRCAFSICCPVGSTCSCAPTCQTITVLPPYEFWQTQIGQRNHVSDGDADTIAYLYGIDADCNGNRVRDVYDIFEVSGTDCNSNGVLDECEIDAGTSADCNSNGLPDECDIATNGDCNGNGVPDDCENDCNCNSIDDVCDLDCQAPGCAGVPGCGQSFDCNSTGVPDECETDCNGDGLADECAIVAQPADSVACPGDIAVFEVMAADPSYTYQWVGPSGSLTNGGRISGATTDTLTISAVEPGDAGSYRCEIRDGCLLAESDSAVLSVKVLGQITTQPAATTYACTGGTALLSIVVSGASPQPTYQWYRGTTPLANGAKYNGVATNQLRVFNVNLADEADYTCMISNGCDSTQSDPGAVRVASPVITLEPEDACGEAGGSVELRAEATAPLAVSYQWRTGSTVVGSGNTLVLDNLQPADAGDYHVLAFTSSPVCITYSDYATVTLATSPVCWHSFPGDMDEDGDYDLKDMQAFLQCFGADVSVDLCCSCANIDDSTTLVDVDDWAALESLLSGPQ